MKKELYIATNNGDMGGGEVMLLNVARAARSLGYKVTIVGPSEPNQLVEAAADEGFARVVLPAKNRAQYMLALRAWHARHKDVLLWCNGLVPAAATGGRKNRIVHLHQLPAGLNAKLVPFARRKASVTLVPSRYVEHSCPGSEVFANWVSGVSTALDHSVGDRRLRVGYLGRLTPSKGIAPLCSAMSVLNSDEVAYDLVIGGEPVFASDEERTEVEEALKQVSSFSTRLGWTTPDQLFGSIDMLVVPSIAPESFGLVVAEAMSARIPVIVSDAGALAEVVGGESYPYIVSAGQPLDLAAAIKSLGEELRENSSDLAERTSELFWRWQENYSPEAGKVRVGEVLERFAR